MYTLAWPEDPLVNKFGILSQPSNYRVNLTETPDPCVNFDYLAKALGCNYGNDSQAELECMKQVSFVQIEETVNNWNATPDIAFNLYIRRSLPCSKERDTDCPKRMRDTSSPMKPSAIPLAKSPNVPPFSRIPPQKSPPRRI